MKASLNGSQRLILAALAAALLLSLALVALLLRGNARQQTRLDAGYQSAAYGERLATRISELQHEAFGFLDYLEIDAAGAPRFDPDARGARQRCRVAIAQFPAAWDALDLVLGDRRYRCALDGTGALSSQSADAEDAAVLAALRRLPTRGEPLIGPASAAGAGKWRMEQIVRVSMDGRLVGFLRLRWRLRPLFDAALQATAARGAALALSVGEGRPAWLWRGASVTPDEDRYAHAYSGFQYRQLDGATYALGLHVFHSFAPGLARAQYALLAGYALAGLAVWLLAWRLMLARQRLARTVAQRTARLRHRLREVGDLREESRLLAGALLEAGETERQRLSGELHDNTGQLLVASRLLADHIGQLGGEAIQPYCRELSEVLGEAVESVRMGARGWGAHGVAEQGVHAALDRLARQSSGGGCRIRVDGKEPALDAESRLHLFRIVQEAINNARRHGGASEVDIALSPVAGQLLRVRDNGRGFEPATAAEGMGLRSLRQRAALLGGWLQLSSRPGFTEIIIAVTAKP